MNWIDSSFIFEAIDKSRASYLKDASGDDCLMYSYHFSTLPDLIKLINETHGDLFTDTEKKELAKTAFRNKPNALLLDKTGDRDVVDFIYEF